MTTQQILPFASAAGISEIKYSVTEKINTERLDSDSNFKAIASKSDIKGNRTALGLLANDGYAKALEYALTGDTSNTKEPTVIDTAHLSESELPIEQLREAKKTIQHFLDKIEQNLGPETTNFVITPDYRNNPFDSEDAQTWKSSDLSAFSKEEIQQFHQALSIIENYSRDHITGKLSVEEGRSNIESIFQTKGKENPTLDHFALLKALTILDNLIESETRYPAWKSEQDQVAEIVTASKSSSKNNDKPSLYDRIYGDFDNLDHKARDEYLELIIKMAFQKADENGDGYLDPQELKKFAEIIASKVSFDPENATVLETGLKLFVEFIKADKDNDGQLDLDELKEFLIKTNPEDIAQILELFKLLESDKNNDGLLSPEELKDYLLKLNPDSAGEIEEAFQLIYGLSPEVQLLRALENIFNDPANKLSLKDFAAPPNFLKLDSSQT